MTLRCSIVAFSLVLLASSASAQNRRFPVPDAAAQSSAEKVVREVFAREYASSDASERIKLAAMLLAQGNETKDNLASRFVLFREARELATAAGDIITALAAIDALAGSFDMDAIEMKLDAIHRAAPVMPQSSRAAVEAALRLADQAMRAERYDAAVRAASIAENAARNLRDPELLPAVSRRAADFRSIQQEARRADEAIKRLRSNPADPSAPLTAGRFLCFIREDFTQGLPILAKSTDGVLKSAAQRDLSNPTDAEAQTRLADQWWDLANRLPSSMKLGAQRRAAHWYRLALPQRAGLSKAMIETRLAGLDEASSTKLSEVGKPSLPASATITVSTQWLKLEAGASIYKNGRVKWAEIPGELRDKTFAQLPDEHQGRTIFSVTKPGLVLMACSTRWQAGGSAAGDWKAECVTEADLLKQGWQRLGSIPIDDHMGYLLFARQCQAGESFTYRTEKYLAPVLIR